MWINESNLNWTFQQLIMNSMPQYGRVTLQSCTPSGWQLACRPTRTCAVQVCSDTWVTSLPSHDVIQISYTTPVSPLPLFPVFPLCFRWFLQVAPRAFKLSQFRWSSCHSCHSCHSCIKQMDPAVQATPSRQAPQFRMVGPWFCGGFDGRDTQPRVHHRHYGSHRLTNYIHTV